MKSFKTILLLLTITTLSSCASRYKTIEPKTINYVSMDEVDGVKLEYKYDLLDKKYAKKEARKGIKVVAIKLTNNSEKEIVFGRDVNLTFENGKEVFIMEPEKVFKTLRQKPASHLWYLLLTPLNLYTTNTHSNGYVETTSSFPIGLFLGPGLSGGNIMAASNANKKFKNEMQDNNLNGLSLKKGEVKYGLIGIKSDSFEALKLKVE